MKRILLLVAIAACTKKTTQPPPAPPESQAQVHGPMGTDIPPPEVQVPANEPGNAGQVQPEPGDPPPKHATAELAPASKSKVRGTAKFDQIDDGVEITVNLEGLKPGEHGWHVHENGDCSAPDAKSAGEHFNPTNQKHGSPDAPEHHAGDFGNLMAGKDGKATKTITMKGVTLAEGPTSLVGRALIIHEKKDDLKTQPSGNAGARIACGVIQAAP